MIYQLDQLQLLGQGGYKIIYQHPTEHDKAIKIMNPNRFTADGEWAHLKGFKRTHAQGPYKQFRREILQYLQLCKNHYRQNRFQFPVETPYGLVQTNKGLGLVVEKIVSPTKQGVTLAKLCQTHQFTEQHAKALDQFFNDCCELHIVYNDVNIEGIMYTETRSNQPEFVLVDGMGEKLFIPIRAMSKRINARNVRKIEQKIRAKMQQYLDTENTPEHQDLTNAA